MRLGHLDRYILVPEGVLDPSVLSVSRLSCCKSRVSIVSSERDFLAINSAGLSVSNDSEVMSSLD